MMNDVELTRVLTKEFMDSWRRVVVSTDVLVILTE